MIVRIKGTLIDVADESAIIERDGLAREVLVPKYSIAELAACVGRLVTFYTFEFLEGNPSMGQLMPRMVGFLRPEERVFFTRFVNVKGIGHRRALRALTEPAARVATWIEEADAKALTRLPGIGPRASEMIIATLKGKMDDLALPSMDDRPRGPAILSDTQRDALEVLVAWGDARNDAEGLLARAMQLHPDLQSADDWVKVAYRIKTGVEG